MSAGSASEIPKGQGYKEDEGLNLESGDEQLLIYIPFNQVIKLHSFAIKGPEEEDGEVMHSGVIDGSRINAEVAPSDLEEHNGRFGELSSGRM